MTLSDLERRMTTALARIEEIREAGLDLPDARGADSRDALLFQLERAAWVAVELGRYWVYERRLGVPKKDTDAFDLPAREGLIGIDEARRLRYVAEFRASASRDEARIDWDYLRSPALDHDLALLRAWLERVSK